MSILKKHFDEIVFKFMNFTRRKPSELNRKQKIVMEAVVSV
ncbi:hypothetical protein VVMO6_03980 [Vibrio vulnificus MO6-24/O]|nr:hypothetical protein VVMO6_03980 [Vibrio vulnificus MO6-24/O]